MTIIQGGSHVPPNGYEGCCQLCGDGVKERWAGEGCHLSVWRRKLHNEFALPYHRGEECLFCKKDMFPHPGYMLRTVLWLQINPLDKGFAHLHCVESHLRRALTAEDFMDCPLNNWLHNKSIFDHPKLENTTFLSGPFAEVQQCHIKQ